MTFAPYPRLQSATLWLLTVFLAASLSVLAKPSLSSSRYFDLPADLAENSLKRLSEQSGWEVLFPADAVAGIRTNAVRGEMPPKSALDAMLQGTLLVGIQDERNGSLTVQRRTTEGAQQKNGSTEDGEKSSVRPTKERSGAATARMSDVPKVAAEDRSETKYSFRPGKRGSDDADSLVEMTPFVVNTSEDHGWLAGSTMLSNRTNQLLKDVPITIDALTKEFLLDVGAYDAFSAAEWTANASVTSENSGIGSNPPPDSNRYAFRGIPNEGGPTRNLFRWLVPTDTYNVERIDFGRGSNSLLFGDNEPGGQGNIYTKRAVLGKTSGNALIQVGSFNSYRANLDYNVALGGAFALRVNTTASRSERDFDYNRFDFRGIHGALTYKAGVTTLIRLEAEAGQYDRTWGTNRLQQQETAAVGLGYQARWTVLPDNTVIDNLTVPAADRRAPTGATFSLLDNDVGGFPRHYNWGGPNQINDREFTTFSAFLEQRLGEDAAFELAYNQQMSVWDEMASRNQFTILKDSRGRRYFNYTINQRHSTDQIQNVRGMLTYNWDRFAALSQFFVLSAELRESQYENDSSLDYNMVGTPTQITYRVYVDEPGAYNPQAVRTRDLPVTSTFRADRFRTGARAEASWARAYAASASGRYFRGRLRSLLGVRLDANKSLTAEPWANANRDALGQITLPGKYEDHPERYVNQDARADVSETTESAGLVYQLTHNLNLYASYATSYRAANGAAINFAGELIGQQHGKTYEVGIKSDFFSQKLVVNLNYYDLVRSNVEFNYALTGVNEDQLEDLFNPNDLPATDPKYIFVNGRREERLQYSKGVELTSIYYPGHGFNVRLAGAFKKVTQDKSMPRFKQLLAEAISRGGENPAYIAAAEEIIRQSGGDGREIAGRYAAPWSCNLAVNYRFPRASRLKSLSLGVNGNYTGDYILGYVGTTPVRGGKQLVTNATAGYRVSLAGYPVMLRLNIRNLLESEHLTTGVVTLSGGGIRSVHSYGEPRSFLLTATTEF